MMEVQQPGILAIWHDIVPEHAADVLAWYNAEHHFERLGVPGFVNVRRYHVVQGSPELFIRYETTSVDVLSSQGYLARLNNPTSWTLRSQPQFRNNSRTVCVRKSRVGQAEGGLAVTVRLAEQMENTSADWDWTEAADTLLRNPAIVSVELWEADRERSTIATKEKQLREGEDRYVGAVVVIHATDRTPADQALATLLALLPPEISATAQPGVYSLAFSAQNAPM